MTRTPVALTIAGSDPSGCAGIQADLKSFAALGIYGCSVITGVTAQNTVGMQGIHKIPASFVRTQMRSVFSDQRVGAVKIGMLSQASVIKCVASELSRYRATDIVLDPVLVATSGDVLLEPSALDCMMNELFPLARLITPNLPEIAALLEAPIETSESGMERQGRLLLKRGAHAVLVKGGHGIGPASIDMLVTGDGVTRFEAPRLASRNTRGTGCSLSAAIAAGLVKGQSLQEAVAKAKQFVTAAVEAADRLEIGEGPGPMHHYFASW